MEDMLGRDGMPLVRYWRTPWFGVTNASFVRELLEFGSIPPKQNDWSGTKATYELVDPRAIYPRELNIPPSRSREGTNTLYNIYLEEP